MNDQIAIELFEKTDSDTAILLVSSVAEGQGPDGAEAHMTSCRHRLPAGWQPRDVATALSNLIVDIADHQGWPREKLIGLVVEEFAGASTAPILGSEADLQQRDEMEAAIKLVTQMHAEKPELAEYLARKMDEKKLHS
jgi:hypothetical protein